MNDYQRLLSDLRAAASGGPYTEALREVLQTHGCYGLPSRPANETDKIKHMILQLIVNERTEAGKNVFEYLKKEHIPYAVVKGAILSSKIYGDETARFSGDVDLLIPRKYSDAAKDCFTENGFIRGRVVGNEIIPYTRKEMIFQATQSHQLAPFVRSTDNKFCPFVNYDVNVELFWGESGKHTDMELFLCDTVPMKLNGTEVQTLPPEKEFTALCLHHYKDLNSVYLLARRGVPLSHFFDIYGYLLTQRPDIKKLRDVCNSIGATKYVYFCIQYVHELFAQPCTEEYLKAFKTSEGEELLGFYGLNDSERRPWNIPIEERIFDKNFHMRFEQNLTDRDREIISMNMDMM